MNDRVSEPGAVYAADPTAVPDASPEETAAKMGLDQLDTVDGFFKRYWLFSKEAEVQDPVKSGKWKRKAEYWRRVAELLWQRKESHR